MTALAVIIPTVGRHSLAATFESLWTQLEAGDRVDVVLDDAAKSDRVARFLSWAAHENGDVTWRLKINHEPLGCYGHPSRNRALDHLATLERAPSKVWSLDDDDVATFGAVDMIRSALEDGKPWHVFRMRGGAGSHFAGVTVPTMGEVVKKGNVGTPMLVFTLGASRFGATSLDEHGPGYLGDFEMAGQLVREFGPPVWVDATIAEIRPDAEAIPA